MKFRASIRRPSTIHRDWFKRSSPKIGGVVNGVSFSLTGRTYVTDELTADQVEALRHHPHVVIEVSHIQTPLIEVVSVNEPAGQGAVAVIDEPAQEPAEIESVVVEETARQAVEQEAEQPAPEAVEQEAEQPAPEAVEQTAPEAVEQPVKRGPGRPRRVV